MPEGQASPLSLSSSSFITFANPWPVFNRGFSKKILFQIGPALFTSALLFLVLLNLTSMHVNAEDAPFASGKGEVVVPTKLGKIRGLVETTKQSSKYYAFKGIRYANSPEKELRFKVRAIVCSVLYYCLMCSFKVHRGAAGTGELVNKHACVSSAANGP